MFHASFGVVWPLYSLLLCSGAVATIDPLQLQAFLALSLSLSLSLSWAHRCHWFRFEPKHSEADVFAAMYLLHAREADEHESWNIFLLVALLTEQRSSKQKLVAEALDVEVNSRISYL